MPFGLLKSATGQLDKIDIALATMGGAVEQQLSDAITAFDRMDSGLAEDVIARDLDIDQQERQIERRVVEALEEKRYTGAALRRAMTAVRIAAEMERIGDLSKNIGKRTLTIDDEAGDPAIDSVFPPAVRMGRRALSQFSDALDSLFRKSPEAALAVRDTDDQIDELYNSIFREILVNMSQYTAGVVVGTHLVFIAKNFERIGDHATNIAERVHFSLTGEALAGERPKSDVTTATTAAATS